MPRKKQKSNEQEILLYADSEQDPDMLYFGKVFVPDPFIAFTSRGRKIAVVSQLEYGRVCSESAFDEVLSMEEVISQAKIKSRGTFHYPANAIAFLGREYKISGFRIPANFPCAVAFLLKRLKVKISVSEGMLFPEREFKNDQEADYIKKGNAAAAAGFRVVEKILRNSQIRRGLLYHEGRRLTSETVQKAIAVACLEHGAIAANPIVAGGDQACDPHCRGTGPLKPDQFIIVDIFPRVSSTGYHGDMTRTYLKGKPSDEQTRLYQTVFEAEQKAIQQHASGKSAKRIYQSVVDEFSGKGYRTERKEGIPVGFIHGLGHGLGLAVHEPPRVNPSGGRLKNGQVITVEPGLYYPGLGGVRVEDVIRVNGKSPDMLSKHAYNWHIR